MNSLEQILTQARACRICEKHIEPRPVLFAKPSAKILLVGQAPGTRVHASGIPWDDPSGKNLREWMGIDNETFYDDSKIAIVPMGFCYPGKGKSGDLPPRKECAPEWHPKINDHLPNIELTLLIGTYAQSYYLGKKMRRTLTETVQAYRDYLPENLPLVHPSPRNFSWHTKNPWFKHEVLPILKEQVAAVLK